MYNSANIPPNAYPRYTPSTHNYTPSLAPAVSIRARSIHSSTNGPGIIAPKPEEPPDPSLEALTKSGLTPAQAYQAQIYRNATPSSLPAVESDDGRLGIDFAAESNSSDQSTDDSSELPWARKEPTHTMSSLPQRGSTTSIPSNRYSNASSTNPSLHVDTASAQSVRSSVASNSPSSFSLAEFNNSLSTETATTTTLVGSSTGRRSSESAHVHRLNGSARRDKSAQDRSMSMSAATNSMRAVLASRVPIPGLPEGASSIVI
ncbi:hypothetical protein FB446DRAFT_427799 [Lentinula raphanica]|nr:hypothetical protein FB446DRAFT_427799 [Lentinula raphanica]